MKIESLKSLITPALIAGLVLCPNSIAFGGGNDPTDTETPIRIKADRNTPGYLKKQRERQKAEGEKQSKRAKEAAERLRKEQEAKEQRVKDGVEADEGVKAADEEIRKLQDQRDRGFGPSARGQRESLEQDQSGELQRKIKEAEEASRKAREEAENKLRLKEGLPPLTYETFDMERPNWTLSTGDIANIAASAHQPPPADRTGETVVCDSTTAYNTPGSKA